MPSLPYLPLLSSLSLKARYRAFALAVPLLLKLLPPTQVFTHALPPGGSPPPNLTPDQPGSSPPGHRFSPLSSLAHSPLGVLGIRLQGHVLALLVDVNTHGMRGELDRVCAHLWVLQVLTDHAPAFAAFAPLNGWMGRREEFNPTQSSSAPSFPAPSLSGWPQALAGPCLQHSNDFKLDMDTAVNSTDAQSDQITPFPFYFDSFCLFFFVCFFFTK